MGEAPRVTLNTTTGATPNKASISAGPAAGAVSVDRPTNAGADEPTHYDGVAAWLHWSVGILLLVEIVFGLLRRDRAARHGGARRRHQSPQVARHRRRPARPRAHRLAPRPCVPAVAGEYVAASAARRQRGRRAAARPRQPRSRPRGAKRRPRVRSSRRPAVCFEQTEPSSRPAASGCEAPMASGASYGGQ